MKLIQEIVAIVRSLHKIIPEPSRAVVAKALGDLIGKFLQESNEETYKLWMGRERNRFFSDCYLTDPARWVPEDLVVDSTPLAEFIQKWMSVEQFKLRDEHAAQFRPITPDMNSLRVTMLKDLIEISETKLEIPRWAGVDNEN